MHPRAAGLTMAGMDTIAWSRTLHLLTTPEMARADALTIKGGVPGSCLMEYAGAAVAAEAARLCLPGSRATPRIAVLCGPGNNGGDGYVAARLLAQRGFHLDVFALGDPKALQGDAKAAAGLWRGRIGALADFAPDGIDLVIDALFGAGLARDLDGMARATVERVNDWRARTGGKILAVDVPSGLDGNSGRPRGAMILADSTVTFFRLKPGHVLLPGRLACGALRLAHIGIPESVLDEIRPATFLNSPALWQGLLPRPQTAGHKYARGHALIVSGPAFHTGAARLATRAAARIGAGLATVAGSRGALSEHAAHLTAIMLAPCEGASDLVRILADPRKNAVVIGPGLGLDEAARGLVHAALAPACGRGVVLDADALTLFAGDAKGLGALVSGHQGPIVLTPHDGEFTRLSNGLELEIESVSQALESISQPALSKLSAARAMAALTGAVVLCKGADTVVAAPDGRASIAADLPADLASAGSGDVLAGMIGGLLAQGMPAFEAASAAVWLHGAAGRKVGRGLLADDLPDALALVLAAL